MRPAQSISFRSDVVDQLIAGRNTRAAFERDNILDTLRLALNERLRNRNDGGWTTNGGTVTPLQPGDDADPTPAQVACFKIRHPDIAERIVALHARGHSAADIQNRASLYAGEPVSGPFIEAILSDVRSEALDWRDRPLEPAYPIVVFERVRVKWRDASSAQNRHCHFALGLQAHGPKEVLGFWLEKGEEAEFWLDVLKDLKARGVADVLYFLGSSPCLAEAQRQTFPSSAAIAHVGDYVRQSQELATSKDRSAIPKALRPVHGALTVDEAQASLERFEAGPLGQRYPTIGPIWHRRWAELTPFLEIPPEIRRVMTSTFAADGLRCGLKKALRSHGHSISVEDATTLLYLVARESHRKWKRPQREWHAAKTQLAMRFPERFA